jgi:hypothetical protein
MKEIENGLRLTVEVHRGVRRSCENVVDTLK